MNFIHGIAGFAKEVDWLIDDVFRQGGPDYRPDCFVCEDGNILSGQNLGGVRVIGDSDFFRLTDDPQVSHDCFVGVGSPFIRERIVDRIKSKRANVSFPSLIHPGVQFDRRDARIVMGEGCVICAGVVLTTDIVIGDFVHLNLDCTVGHDSVLESYCTLSPGVHVSGNVMLRDHVFIGTGACLIEGIEVVPGVVIGAGAAVVKNLVDPGTYVGVPAQLRVVRSEQ